MAAYDLITTEQAEDLLQGMAGAYIHPWTTMEQMVETFKAAIVGERLPSQDDWFLDES
jgi:hypothetical protein